MILRRVLLDRTPASGVTGFTAGAAEASPHSLATWMTCSRTRMDDPEEKLTSAAEKFAAEIGRFVVPLCMDGRRGPVSFGSGFFVEAGDRVALVTAAHVLDPLERGVELYFYADAAMKRLINGRVLRTAIPTGGERDPDDKLDVGIAFLEGRNLPPYPVLDKAVLPLSSLGISRNPRAIYFFLGFPGSRGTLNPVTKTMTSRVHSHLRPALDDKRCEEIGFDPRCHIALQFNAKKTTDLAGRKRQFPDPRGMSGSPLLTTNNDGELRVAGVMTHVLEKHECVVATDIRFALDMISRETR